jgi:hypothetical protein
VKISIQKSVKNFVSPYREGSKKFLDFLDFCEKLPALLIENFTAESAEDVEIELDPVSRHGTYAALRPAVLIDFPTSLGLTLQEEKD